MQVLLTTQQQLSDYAKELVSYHIHAGKYGKTVLKHKMKTKGFSEETIDAALAAYSGEAEYQNAERIYNKLMEANQNTDPLKRREKIYRSLASKGFSYDVISDLLKTGGDS